MGRATSFVWQGASGSRIVSGEIDAADARMARARLRRQGIDVQRLRRKRPALLGSRIKAADITLFSRQLATMLRSGVPLLQAFDIVASGVRNAKLATLARGLRDEVAAGGALAKALAKHPSHFDAMTCRMVAIGEQSGTLDTMLARIASCQERSDASRRKVKKAMTYPLLVLAGGALVATLMLVKVVPQFESVFASAGGELPAFTRFVIQLSALMRSWWWAAAIAAVAATLGPIVLKRHSARFRDALDRLVLSTPVAGSIAAKTSVARFARALATAVEAGVPLLDALDAVAGATGNVVVGEAVHGVRDAVAAGQPLHRAMAEQRVFPHLLVQLVAVGEEAGTLTDMLGKAADQFDAQADDAVDTLATLVEPLLMAVLGVLVGGLVLAMYLPVFQLGAVFG